MDQVKIGQYISKARKEKEMTQEDIAEKLGVSQRTVSRWETGKNMPDLAVIPELCNILDINISDFFKGETSDSGAVTKEEFGTYFKDISFISDKKIKPKKIIGAIISFILMVVFMIGSYNTEFSINIASTSGLEAVLDENVIFIGDAKPHVLKIESAGNKALVLFELDENLQEFKQGLVVLEKGIFGKYRILNASCSNSNLVLVSYISSQGNDYIVTYDACNLPGVSSYDVMGYRNSGAEEPWNDLEVLASFEYTGSPFLTVTKTDVEESKINYFDDGRVYRDSNGDEIDKWELLPYSPDGWGSAEYGSGIEAAGLIYAYEAIILILGAIFIRYFLT